MTDAPFSEGRIGLARSHLQEVTWIALFQRGTWPTYILDMLKNLTFSETIQI